VIGGGDWARDRIVPDIARAALQSQRVTIRNPKSTRPWQHVLDVLLGYLDLAERLATDPVAWSDAWNFGPPPSDVRSVGDLADAMCKAWGPGASWHHEAGNHPHEAHVLTLDATRARTVLGWRPRLPFDEGVRWTADWYKQHRDDVVKTTLGQLHRFAELA
jgi:CDP-glucose 4,6-dehydratase